MKSNALLIIILIAIIAIVGIYFGYNMFFNKPNLTNVSNESLPLNNTNSSTNITSSNNYQNLTTHIVISSNTTSANNYQNVSNNYLNNYSNYSSYINIASVNNYQNTSNNYLNNYSNYSSYINIGYNQYIPITIYNTQDIPTPSPFQQQIAICNGTINIGPNFAYVNNVTLFNLINENGSNVYFTTTNNDTPNMYSWYLGQLVNGSTHCKIWWINISNGIPANSNVTIYMYIGNGSSNFYQQYYPYVGASPQVDPSRQYDNGKYVFIAYGYFNNTTDGWKGYVYAGLGSPTATPYGIEMLDDQTYQARYILPPNNWNIPLIPLIVEEAWYHTKGADANVIALFGNTSQQLLAGTIGDTYGGATPAPNLSTFVQFEYYYGADPPDSKAAMLKSAVTNQYLYYVYFSPYERTVYSYLIVNSTYAEAGYYIYSYYGYAWIPLTLLNTYSRNYHGYVYANLDYNPFQYGTLQISAGTSGAYSYQYIQWVVARAYPPNGVMPRIYLG